MRSGRYLRLAVLGLSLMLLVGCSGQENGLTGDSGAVIPAIDTIRPGETEIAAFALG
jgi:hypothetical protein